MRYKKETSRIPVQFIDDATDNMFAEIKDRSHLNVGDIFTDSNLTSIMQHEFTNKTPPKRIMVLAIAYFNLVEE